MSKEGREFAAEVIQALNDAGLTVVEKEEFIERRDLLLEVTSLRNEIRAKDELINGLKEDIARWAKAAQRAINERDAVDLEIKRLRRILKRIGDLRFCNDPLPDIARLVDETLEVGVTADE